jgi:hypothetical protein
MLPAECFTEDLLVRFTPYSEQHSPLGQGQTFPQGGVMRIFGSHHSVESSINHTGCDSTACRTCQRPGKMCQLLRVMWMIRGDRQEMIDGLLVDRYVGDAAALADIRRKLAGSNDSEWERTRRSIQRLIRSVKTRCVRCWRLPKKICATSPCV